VLIPDKTITAVTPLFKEEIMPIKTAQNKNIYLEEESGGQIPSNPAPKAFRWVGDTVEGSYEKITNDTKLPGRNPEKDRKGTDSSAGDFTAKFAPLEQDALLQAVLCGTWAAVELPVNDPYYATHNAWDLVPGATQRSFYMLKEFAQAPARYQLFTGLQVNTLNMQMTVKSLVNAVFGLMGGNNPRLEETSPVSLAGKAPAETTAQFTTLEGFIKFGETAAALTQYRKCTDLSITINNNMKSLDALFETEAVEKSLGMLDIGGSITDYLVGGELYNKAKNAESGVLNFALISGGYVYDFLLNVTFDNSSISGEEELSAALPWNSYGPNRFRLRKYAPKA
jgi:hypothetical protein